MTTLIFATSDGRAAAERLRAANQFITDDQVARIVALVEAGAVRVADPNMHSAGDVFLMPAATPEQIAEAHAVGAEVYATTVAASAKAVTR